MECFGELSPSRNKIPEKNITEVKTKITHLFQVLDFVRQTEKNILCRFVPFRSRGSKYAKNAFVAARLRPGPPLQGSLQQSPDLQLHARDRFAAKEKGAEEGWEHGRSLNLVHGGLAGAHGERV